PGVALRIERSIRGHGVTKSGKIEILFNEAEKPLPFREFKLIDVKQIGNKTLKTEIATDEPLRGWEEYADLQLLSAIVWSEKKLDKAKQNLSAAAAMWDVQGFHDRAAKSSKQYATYKLALYLIAA